MADTRISALPAITAAETADADLLPIVDQSAGANRKMTFGEAKVALSVDALAAQAAAELAQAAAEQAAVDAESAATSALAASNAYASTAAGLSGTVSGDVFLVATADPQIYTVYSNSSGSAVLVGTLNIADGRLVSDDFNVTGYAYVITDQTGKIAVGVKSDGTLYTIDIEATNLTATNLNSTPVASIEQAVTMTAYFVDHDLADYEYVIKDTKGKIAFGIKTDGSIVLGEADIRKLSRAGSFSRMPGAYTHQIGYIGNCGQSNAGGNTETDLTTTQEYDNVGFPSFSTAPTEFLPLTLANTRNGGGTYRESPLYGGLGHAKELILEENGISYTVNDYQLVGANNAIGNTAIADLDKPSTAYDATIAQVQAAYNIATASGKSMAFQAVFWTQGESDAALATGAYKTLLKQLVADFNADAVAITGQFNPVHLISWQVSSVAVNVARETLEAANESDIIHVACPAYMLTYGDSVHINAASAKWLGGYYGLVYKRVVIDRKEWSPLQPVGHAINGTVIDLIFNKTGLVLDTTIVPAQTNYGFVLENAGGATISSVAIVAPNRVRITASAAVGSGWSVKYGVAATGKLPYVGAAGNLRDSAGDRIVYNGNRMDNWCVLFNYSL